MYSRLLRVMPSRPPRPCAVHPWALVNDGDGCNLCDKRPLPSRLRDGRPSASQRGYGVDHQRKRYALMKKRVYCENPYGLHRHIKVKGTIRDHKVPLNGGGSDDESNEQLLCVRCHNIKIYRDGSRGRGRRTGKSL